MPAALAMPRAIAAEIAARGAAIVVAPENELAAAATKGLTLAAGPSVDPLLGLPPCDPTP
jgi:hypothetical protein